MQLKSNYKGISFDPKQGRWKSKFKSKHVGWYKTEREAARARDLYILKNNLDGEIQTLKPMSNV